jgi:hypothetical protein
MKWSKARTNSVIISAKGCFMSPDIGCSECFYGSKGKGKEYHDCQIVKESEHLLLHSEINDYIYKKIKCLDMLEVILK